MVDIENMCKPKEHYDFYLVDLDNVDKQVSADIHYFFENVQNPLIYFFVPKDYKISLIQLAFMVQAKSIITTIQDTNKVITKIHKDYQFHLEQDKALSLGTSLVNNHSYLIYKDNELTFASEQLLRDLDCSSKEEAHRILSSKIEIDDILERENAINKFVYKINQDITFFVKSIRSENYTLISLEVNNDYEQSCGNNTNYISTRLSFIELLKDKMLEKMMSNKNLAILTMRVESVSKSITKIEEENFRKKFIYEIEQILDSKISLAEYHTDFYVALFENTTFQELKDRAKNYHLQILNFLNKQKIKHIISLCVVNIQDDNLNPVLTTLDEISDDTIEEQLLNEDYIEYINDFQEGMQTPDIINYLLDTIFINKNDLKLLNIYNGMSITTSSKIIKKTDSEIYIRLEPLQGFVVNIDKSTMLQSSVLAKTIKASLKHINIKERYAVLHKFRFLDYNPNERQHGRVKSDKIVPVAISLIGLKVKGEMIDVSATSIAIKIKKTRALNNIINKEVGLTFYVDNPKIRGASVKLKESAVVLHESEADEHGNIKLTCIFNENMQNENTLIDYIFNRQKSIIQHIKNRVS